MSVGISQADDGLYDGLRKEVKDFEQRSRKLGRKDGVIDSGFGDESYASSRVGSTRDRSGLQMSVDDDGYSSLSFRGDSMTVGETSAQRAEGTTESDAPTERMSMLTIDEQEASVEAPKNESIHVPSFISSTIRQAMGTESWASQTSPSSTGAERKEYFTENTHYHNFACSGEPRYLLAPFRQLLSVPNEDGDTALHLSVINFQEHIVGQILTTRPGDVEFFDQRNNIGQTALHLAIMTNQPRAVGFLLSSGADPTKVDRFGNTSLHIAVGNGFCHLASLILESCRRRQIGRKQLLDQRNFEGLTCLHMASHLGDVNTMSFLVSQGAEVDSQDYGSGRSALHHAVENNQLSVTSALLFRLGAYVDAATFDGATPLHLAAGRGLTDMAALLVAAGANAHVKNAEEDRPIDLTRSESVLGLLKQIM